MKKTALMVTLAAMTAATGWALSDENATPAPARHAWGLKADMAQLDLTAAQQQQVQEIFTAARPAVRLSMQAMRDARLAVADAIRENPSDEATVRSKSAQLATALTDFSVQQARLHAQIAKVLTPEQAQKWNGLQQAREARRAQAHHGHEHEG